MSSRTSVYLSWGCTGREENSVITWPPPVWVPAVFYHTRAPTPGYSSQNTLAPLAPMVKAHSKVGVVGATAYPVTTDLQQWQQPWKAGGIRLLCLPSPAPNPQPLCPPLCFLGFPWYLESAGLVCFLRRPFVPLMLFPVVSPLSIPLPSSHIHFYCFTVFATKPEGLLYQVTWHLHGPSGGHSSWSVTCHCPSARSP